MSTYLYGYVWRNNGRMITDEREHASTSEAYAVVTSEIMRWRTVLGLPTEAVPTILWKQEERRKLEDIAS